ncbi:transposase family protein [Streptomyces sp. NPDC002092]
MPFVAAQDVFRCRGCRQDDRDVHPRCPGRRPSRRAGEAEAQAPWFHQVEDVVSENVVSAGGLVAVRARTAVDRAACPECGTLTVRVHCRYGRRLADSAVGRRPVLIESRVRRLRYGERACERATFAEHVDGLTLRRGGEAPARRQYLSVSWCCRPSGPAHPPVPDPDGRGEQVDADAADPPPARARDDDTASPRGGRVRPAQARDGDTATARF